MSQTDSYIGKTFTVVDPDARIRRPGDLMEFQKYTAADPLPPGEMVGNFKRVQQNTKVKVDDIEIVHTGSSGSIVFGHALSLDGATEFGWTSTRNFAGKFVNETLGELSPAPRAGKFGPNAAWAGGNFLGQRTLVEIVDAKLEIERIALDTLEPYLALVSAAAADSVSIAINSGFRSYPEQKLLFDGFKKHLPGFNTAAPPGTSKHQNGIAFDIRVAGGDGDPVYEWLKKNGPAHGFIRTVNKEPWHWEFDKVKAAKAVANHTFKASNVAV
jgi:D-alanyl-D-alanine carboxypeptidase